MMIIIIIYFVSYQGLTYIHSMGLVHLDIKPENVFISLPTLPDSRLPPEAEVSWDSLLMSEALYKIGTTDQHGHYHSPSLSLSPSPSLPLSLS